MCCFVAGRGRVGFMNIYNTCTKFLYSRYMYTCTHTTYTHGVSVRHLFWPFSYNLWNSFSKIPIISNRHLDFFNQDGGSFLFTSRAGGEEVKLSSDLRSGARVALEALNLFWRALWTLDLGPSRPFDW